MRITQSMMMKSAAYATSKQLTALNDLSLTVTSGQNINCPSDDPAGYSQILRDTATLSDYGRYEANILQAQNWIEADNTTLDATTTLLEDAQSLLDSVESDSDPGGSLEQLKSIYAQVLDYANSRYDSGYMYSGDHSTEAPYTDTVQVSGGSAKDIAFELAGDAAQVTVRIADSSGATVRTITAGSATAGANEMTWDGLDDVGNTLPDGEYDFTVTALDSDGDTVAEYPIYRGDGGGKNVKASENNTITLNNDGSSIYGQAIGALSQGIAALENSDVDSSTIAGINSALQDAIDTIQGEQVALSNQASQLENSSARLENLTLILNNRISDLQDVDDTTAAVELEAKETAYEEALAATEKILTMSKLIDYMG